MTKIFVVMLECQYIAGIYSTKRKADDAVERFQTLGYLSVEEYVIDDDVFGSGRISSGTIASGTIASGKLQSGQLGKGLS